MAEFEYVTLKSSELRTGMIVHCSGMRCLIRGEINSRENVPQRYGPGDHHTYWTTALVLNRDEVSPDRVPFGFTRPRLRNGLDDEEAIARGEAHWGIQGNDNASWAVEVAWCRTAEQQAQWDLIESLYH